MNQKERLKNHKQNCSCCICKAIRGEVKGKDNSNWKHGKTNNNKCEICEEKISLNSRRCNVCAGGLRGRKGLKRSKETRELIKKKAEERYRIPENNPNYIDGRSFEPYTIEFNNELKELIRLRDGYKCQKCGCPEIEEGKKLSVHHIDYTKKNCLPSNLITLCRLCNVKVNSGREKWAKYFNRKVKKIMGLNQMQLNFRYEKIKG